MLRYCGSDKVPSEAQSEQLYVSLRSILSRTRYPLRHHIVVTCVEVTLTAGGIAVSVVFLALSAPIAWLPT